MWFSFLFQLFFWWKSPGFSWWDLFWLLIKSRFETDFQFLFGLRLAFRSTSTFVVKALNIVWSRHLWRHSFDRSELHRFVRFVKRWCLLWLINYDFGLFIDSGNADIDFVKIGLYFLAGKGLDCISFDLVFEVGLEILDFLFVEHVLVPAFPALIVGWCGLIVLILHKTVSSVSTVVVVSLVDSWPTCRGERTLLFEFDVLFQEGIDLFIEKGVLSIVLF